MNRVAMHARNILLALLFALATPLMAQPAPMHAPKQPHSKFAQTKLTASPAGAEAHRFAQALLSRLNSAVPRRHGPRAFASDPAARLRRRIANAMSPGLSFPARQRNAATTYTYHYDPVTHRISDVNGVPYGHDARGNVTSIGDFALNWNHANELVSDGFGSTYAYDARGQRVKQTVTAQHSADGLAHTKYYIYDHNHRLVALIDNGQVTNFIRRQPPHRKDKGRRHNLHPYRLPKHPAVHQRRR